MDKPKHITALVPYRIYPAKMGGQKGIALFYEYLSQLLPVTIISTTSNTAPHVAGIQFIPALGQSKTRYFNPFLFFRIRKILKESGNSALILEHPYFGWLGFLLKTFCGTRLIIHSHNIESIRFKSTGKWWWRLLWQYEKYTHRQSDINFFITDEDREFAVKHFGLQPENCHTITYGFEMSEAPSKTEKASARLKLQQLHPVMDNEKILLFNGTLDYKPNLDAVDGILNKMNPLLLSQPELAYKIIICGKGLPAEYNKLEAYENKNIIYAGFVDDINIYFKGADIFINPVTDGGGIKTKVVEALGNGLSVISMRSGATGIPVSITGDKMKITADDDWQEFAGQVKQINALSEIPFSFFEHFYWHNIAKKAAGIISN